MEVCEGRSAFSAVRDDWLRHSGGGVVRRGLPRRREECLDIGDRWPQEWGGVELGVGWVRGCKAPLASFWVYWIRPFAAATSPRLCPSQLLRSLADALVDIQQHLPWPVSIWNLPITITLRPLPTGLAKNVLQYQTVGLPRPRPATSTNTLWPCIPLVNTPSARIEDHDLVECIDLISALPRESSDPHPEPALSLGATEGRVKGNVHSPWRYRVFNNDFQMPPSMVPDPTENLIENDRPFPSPTEGLRGAEEAQYLQQAVASANGATEPLTSINRDGVSIPGARGDED